MYSMKTKFNDRMDYSSKMTGPAGSIEKQFGVYHLGAPLFEKSVAIPGESSERHVIAASYMEAIAVLHSASLAFLKEFQSYKADPDSLLFIPSKEVLKAFEEAVEGK